MFTTKVDIPKSSTEILYEDSLMTLGSCFSDNIGKKLQNVYFAVDSNPFGVLYNPASIHNSLTFLLENRRFTKDDLFFDGSLWHSFSHSSLFSDVTFEACLQKINARMEKACCIINQTKFLILTLGTAWVYEYVKSGQIVSNCHKLPAKEFVRYRLTVEDIVADYKELIFRLTSLLPDLHIVFTVSPIRHWKDGVHENNISKAILLMAIDTLQKEFENVSYFPAYEIQLDELRDYRYYASDMLHPSEVAVDYIWERFSDTYFSDETKSIKKKMEQYSADVSHRPICAESIEYKKFQDHISQNKSKLLKEYPFLESRI